MDVSKEIRRAVDTGKVCFGSRESEKSILKGSAQLIILSSNAPKQVSERFKHYSKISNVPVFEFKGTGLELGAVCGKPFVVSVALVESVGKSTILKAVEN